MPSSFSIQFSKSFAADRLAPLRDVLTRSARVLPEGAVRVMTVEDTETVASTRDVVVLLDLHVAYVCGPNAPIGALQAHVRDATAPGVAAACRDACAAGAFPFAHDPEQLAVIETLLPRTDPASVTAVNLQTGEIRPVDVAPHPRADGPLPALDDLPAATPDPETIPTLRAFVDPTPSPVNDAYRGGSVPGGAGLTDPYAGIIRKQSTVRTPAGRLLSLSHVARRRATEPEHCGGQHTDRAHAAAVSRCEAVERFAVFHRPSGAPVYVAAYREVCEQLGAGAVVDPAFLHYRPIADPAFDDYSPETPLAWTWAWDVAAHRSILCPAEEVWFDARHTPGTHPVVQSTTSGAAVGGSVQEALLFGLLEAVERDGYMTTWVLRRPCPKLDLARVSHPAFHTLRRRVQMMHPGVKLHFFDATNDCRIPVVWGIAERTSGTPARVHASAAHLDAERAMRAVLEDLDMFLNAGHDPERADHLAAHPDAVESAEDHRLLHGRPEAGDALAFLPMDAPATRGPADVQANAWRPPDTARGNLQRLLPALARHLADCDVQVLGVNLTPDGLAAEGLHVARAVTPGLVPPFYGTRRARVHCTPRLHRLWAMTHATPLEREALHLEAHPFS